MKRHACWLLPTLLFLAACTGSGTTAIPSAPPTLAPMPTPVYLPENATTGARILARGHLLVGIRYDLPPFGHITASGEPAGFGVDMGRELARRWLNDAEAVQFRQVRSDTAVDHLVARDVDLVITALAHTQDGEAGADFTQTYFVDGQALLVRTPDQSTIDGPEDLFNQPVGVVSGNDAEDALWAAVVFTPTIQRYDRFDEAVDALSWGGVDAVADLRHRLFWGRHTLPETAIVGQYTTVPMAIAYPQNDPFFADLVNLTLQEMVADGSYEELYQARFGPEYPPPIEQWPGDSVPRLEDAPVTTSIPRTIDAIRMRGRLTVAMVNRVPFATLDENGVSVGYEASLVRQMAEYWMGDSTAVDFISVSEEDGRQMLLDGQADVLIGGLVHSREAEMAIDHSSTIYVTGESLLVMADSGIEDLTSLNGQQVASISGSGSGERLLDQAQAAGVSLTVVPRPSLDSAMALLIEGQASAVVGERTDLLVRAQDAAFIVLPLRLTQVPLALGLPPGDSAFRDLVNLTLQTLQTEGQFATLYRTWFSDAPTTLEIWPGTPYQTLRLR